MLPLFSVVAEQNCPVRGVHHHRTFHNFLHHVCSVSRTAVNVDHIVIRDLSAMTMFATDVIEKRCEITRAQDNRHSPGYVSLGHTCLRYASTIIQFPPRSLAPRTTMLQSIDHHPGRKTQKCGMQIPHLLWSQGSDSLGNRPRQRVLLQRLLLRWLRLLLRRELRL